MLCPQTSMSVSYSDTGTVVKANVKRKKPQWHKRCSAAQFVIAPSSTLFLLGSSSSGLVPVEAALKPSCLKRLRSVFIDQIEDGGGARPRPLCRLTNKNQDTWNSFRTRPTMDDCSDWQNCLGLMSVFALQRERETREAKSGEKNNTAKAKANGIIVKPRPLACFTLVKDVKTSAL